MPTACSAAMLRALLCCAALRCAERSTLCLTCLQVARLRTRRAGHIMQTPILQSCESSRPCSSAASRILWSSSTVRTDVPLSCWIVTCAAQGGRDSGSKSGTWRDRENSAGCGASGT